MRLARFVLFAVSVLAFGLLSGCGSETTDSSLAQGQLDCTVTVKSGESIQKAIDVAKEGAVLCLEVGEWREHLTISKSIALRGAGREQTKIKGKEGGKPIIKIASDAEIAVRIERVTIAEAKRWSAGIGLSGKAKVTLTNSQLSGNRHGISMWGLAQAIITNSQLSDNNDGIVMGDSAQATITNSQLSGNGDNGIYTGGSAQAKIRDSTIESNGTNKYCKRKDHICNGIQVGKKSQVKIIDSKIIKNADWGVGAELKQCGSWDDFTGQVAFEDMMLEDISGNNTTGKKKGMGNPGNHYWNRPDILDGQVCLP